MLAFIASLLFGAGQACLTGQLVKALNTRRNKNVLLLLGTKFVLYTLGIGLVVLKFVWYMGMMISGFAVGVSIAAIVLFIYKMIYKK